MAYRNRVILHVDDDPAQLRIVRHMLEKKGYAIHSTTDPTQVRQLLLETGARLVLLDIDMPHTDGLALLKQIKSFDGGIQVIMLTGVVTMSTVLRSLRWGAEACVFKPVTDPNDLAEPIEATFRKIDRWWAAVDYLAEEKRRLRHNTESSTPA